MQMNDSRASRPAREAAQQFVAALAQFSVLRASGDDAAAFLQGQLTCDVAGLAPEAASWGGYCSPKGRLLATFLVWRSGADYCLMLPAATAPSVQKRLSMYILRSRVRLESAGLALLGRVGADALPPGEAPAEVLRVRSQPDGAALIRLDAERMIVAAAEAASASMPAALASTPRQADPGTWDLTDIDAGIPWILPATQERFVPQMVNLECLGGVSFSKGCYTGQEVVARAQHLGKVKRRMYRAKVDAPCAPGDDLYAADLGDQASGQIVNACGDPSGGSRILAVVQTTSREHSSVHLRAPDGPRLEFLPLPYPVA